MTKFLKVMAAATLLVSSAIAAEYTIKVTHVVSPNTPKGKGADFFAKRVGELTNGKVEVIVFPNSQLYGDGEEMKALKLGNAHIAMPSFSKFTSLVPEMQLFDLPFIFRDKDHLYKVLDGEVGQILKDKVSKKGFVALDYWDAGFKHLSSNKKPILLPEDAAGQKFRIMSSHVLEAQFKAVGANPQVLPFSEVYSALQQGVVDGAENPLSNFYTKKFNEVQTDLTLSNHGYLGYLVIMSESFWKKFPKDLKPMVLQAMKEATEYERKEAALDDEDMLAKISEYAKASGNLKIHTLTPEQKAAWQKAMEAIYPQFYKTIGEDLIKKVQAVK
ncbi:TRAP transporter substrate-binding protein [Sulfurospirillum deleyianum]|uniref:TRAP dicarboxylate transporter, DctP subunit n=1 Tax=Sulfurospirillum deleyianum (strain ATCC 51133 / DSM 6946 / 5175) TaxID=525898 RepID=D1AZL7_SULD5|nr:TRAP transporter substrate-binding protein [Sulfurospirillum deleyianum]ACZ11484.1 TRAP dicarboxylate transporter, DctP subunit [Sulfurospirillum deleyianum DSM 6946]